MTRPCAPYRPFLSGTQTLFIVFVLFVPAPQGAETISGDALNPIALSQNGKLVAVEQYDSVEGLGGEVSGRILIIEIESGRVTDRIPIAFNENRPPYEGTSGEKMAAINRKLHAGAMTRLKKEGFGALSPTRIKPTSRLTMDEMEIGYNEYPKGENNVAYSFFLRDTVSGYRREITRRVHQAREREAVNITGISVGRSFLLIIYKTGRMMEYNPGEQVLLVINRFALARFFNASGMELYRKKEYLRAANRFEQALTHNELHHFAAYNGACMHALLGDADRSIALLKKLKAMKTPGAAKRLKRVAGDSDFDPVRNTEKFKAFIQKQATGRP